ncbi:MAG: SIMPL domain-containing protein [Steroidobacteraceae bacterium]
MNDAKALGQPLSALLVAIGLAASGYFIGHGLLEARSADRYVTVKGLAEREVKADLVIWPLRYAVTADDLASLQRLSDDSEGKVRAFLGERFPGDDISVSAPQIQDRNAQGMADRSGNLQRYVAEVTVTLRSKRIDEVRKANELLGDLVKAGVALVQNYESRTQYSYTGLDQVKPAMIAEATKDARQAAEQFAKDSGSAVGSIRNAQQGYFSIEDRDAFSPEYKQIRVVTTVQFFLED